jgi:hypothetical protein
MATEILRAMGAGLPLAKGDRGPMRIDGKSPLTLEAADAVGVLKKDGALDVKVLCRNTSKKALKGKVTIVAGGHKEAQAAEIAPGKTLTLSFKIPAAKLTGRWAVVPLYMTFAGKSTFTAAHALLHYSRIHTPNNSLVVTGKDLGGSAKNPCPVRSAKVTVSPRGMRVTFKWTDANVVTGKDKFKHRFGYMVEAPLDLGARDGQPCDAVELLFDLRPHESAGRYTSSVDANPKGVIRMGVCKVKVGGKVVAKLVTPKGLPAGTVRLAVTDKDTYAVEFERRNRPSTIGFSMRVTNADKYGQGRLFRLTGRVDVVHEPMSYIRISPNTSGIFYRIGY